MEEKPARQQKTALPEEDAAREKTARKAARRVLPLCLALVALAGYPGSPRELDDSPRLLLLGDPGVAAVDPASLESRPAPRQPVFAVLAALADGAPGAVGLHGSFWSARGTNLVLVNEAGHELSRERGGGRGARAFVRPCGCRLWSVEGRVLVARDLVSGDFLRRHSLPDVAVPVQLAASPRSGLVWLATGNEVLVTAPHGEVQQLRLPDRVDTVRVDGSGAAWALAGGRLFHLSPDEALELSLPPSLRERHWLDLEAQSRRPLADGWRCSRPAGPGARRLPAPRGLRRSAWSAPFESRPHSPRHRLGVPGSRHRGGRSLRARPGIRLDGGDPIGGGRDGFGGRPIEREAVGEWRPRD